MTRKYHSAASAKAARGRRERTQRDVRGLLIRVNADGLRALRQLALDQDTTLQGLGVEALNDLLRKHGARAVVTNPLHEPD